MNTLQITDDLDLLLSVLPERIAQALEESERKSNLLEIVMDLGRLPEARFSDGEMVLSKHEITLADLQMVVEHVGNFGRTTVPVSNARCTASRPSATAKAT
jgi:stage III sporulation protein SpoIIIAA